MSSSQSPVLFDACTPREDVLDGTLQEDQFAASLATVAHAPDESAPVYRGAEQFFSMTYPTEGLKTLLSNLTGRFLASTEYGSSDYTNSILCLDTRFGGGKTHDLIASYHIATHAGEIKNLDEHLLDGDDDVANTYIDAIKDGLNVDTAVFVGGHVDARNARSDRMDPDAPNTRTMWGEIAYQLYGLDGYELIKKYDRNRNAPGQNTLKNLFEISNAPALVLIDEIAAYLEAASAVEVGSATLASQTLSFILSLLETASESDNVTVVYSIADTAFEDEAEDVRALIDELNQIGRRQHKTVTPTDESEVGKVLQHRLFEDIDKQEAKDIVQEYFQFYTNSDRQFPQEATDASYVERLEREYPFHPTVIDTLTEKIDTIPKFQRTRGALKLLARAVYYRWNDQPQNYDRHWLRLYDLTPADNAPSGSINSTLRESLFEFVDLSSAVSADIYNDDGTAHAQLEDRKWTEKGIPPLGSHLTTTVLWHSLAYGEQATGLTRAELNSTLGHPDIRFDNYDSALEALGGSDMSVACYYLYDEERVRFKSDPNLIRIIDQRVDNTPDAQARSRFEARLESETGSGALKSILYPESPADLPDDASTPQMAIMHMDTAPVTEEVLNSGMNKESVPEKVDTLYQKSATKHGSDARSRVYKNYVIFLSPDAERVERTIDEARHLEAIEALLDDSQQTADLSEEQIAELKERKDQKYGLLGELVRGVYRHLYYIDRDGLTHITINATEANGGTSLVSAVEETLDDRLIRADADPKGIAFFKQKLWQKTRDSMTTRQLVEQFAKKPGLPYLLSTKPLRKTVAKMINDSGHVYWDSESGTAYWDGNEDDRPSNWRKRDPLSTSPDICTSTRDTDIKIGDSYVVYTDIGACLDVHHDEIQEPELDETECSEPGCNRVIASSNENTVYCEKHKLEKMPCQDCGKLFEKTELTKDGLCSDCPQTEGWERSTSQMAASRAFNEVRAHALSESISGGRPGVSQVTVEVVGEDRLSKGLFVADRGAFVDRNESVSVRLDYEIKTDAGNTYNAKYRGNLNDFSRVAKQPDPFGNSVNTVVKFRLEFNNPEMIQNDESDILAQLQDELGETNIDVKIQARGPTGVPPEATQ